MNHDQSFPRHSAGVEKAGVHTDQDTVWCHCEGKWLQAGVLNRAVSPKMPSEAPQSLPRGLSQLPVTLLRGVAQEQVAVGASFLPSSNSSTWVVVGLLDRVPLTCTEVSTVQEQPGFSRAEAEAHFGVLDIY